MRCTTLANGEQMEAKHSVIIDHISNLRVGVGH